MGELLPCHGDILHVLTEQETATVMELARLTHRSKSTVSALVTKLVDLGYVARERSAEDSRVINLRLTEKGRAFIPVSERISSELDALVTCSLTPDGGPLRRSAPRENPQRLFLRQVRLRPSGHFRRAFRPDLNHGPASSLLRSTDDLRALIRFGRRDANHCKTACDGVGSNFLPTHSGIMRTPAGRVFSGAGRLSSRESGAGGHPSGRHLRTPDGDPAAQRQLQTRTGETS